MELHQVRYFLAVASTLNFTRAAEQCNVTQPALTKGVQKLEHRLGGQLIHRERELTQLTDLGKEVLPMLERTLASAEAVRRTAKEFQRKEVAPPRSDRGDRQGRPWTSRRAARGRSGEARRPPA
jgi:DNA-binding transcriptional LysR family regulator